MFADGVDFVNIGAAGQQQFGHFLFLVEGDGIGGQRQQGGSATRDQAKHQIVRARARGDFGDAPRAFDTLPVGHGMAALIQRDAAQWRDVAILHVQQSPGDTAAEHALRCARHGRAGFPRPHYIYVAITGEVLARQMAGNGFGGIGGAQRGLENGERLAAKSGFGFHLNNGSFRTASTLTAGSSLSMGMR